MLRLGGKTLLAHIRRAARQTGFPVRLIRRDLIPQCGPLGGVYTALRTTKAEGVLVLSCDMPFISSQLLNRLVSNLRPRVDAVFLLHGKVGFPFVIRRSALSQVEELLARKRYSIHALANRLNAARLRLPKRQTRAAININTPEDYGMAQRIWRQTQSVPRTPLKPQARRNCGPAPEKARSHR